MGKASHAARIRCLLDEVKRNHHSPLFGIPSVAVAVELPGKKRSALFWLDGVLQREFALKAKRNAGNRFRPR